MWLRTLLRTWLGRRQGPIQTRKKIGARKPVKPMLEILEDRLAPAAVSLVNGAGLHCRSERFKCYHHGDRALVDLIANRHQRGHDVPWQRCDLQLEFLPKQRGHVHVNDQQC